MGTQAAFGAHWAFASTHSLAFRLFGSTLRQIEALPLPAGQAPQKRGTNLDVGGWRRSFGEITSIWGKSWTFASGKGRVAHDRIFGLTPMQERPRAGAKWGYTC
jgi:hypothetical protein